MPYRIYLSPPHMDPLSRELLLDAYDSNWVAPVGPHLTAFEKEFSQAVQKSQAIAMSSGTAALHLALEAVGVRAGDDVIVPSLTFVATANAVRYLGAHPVFVDSDPTYWMMNVDLVEQLLEDRHRANNQVAAVVAVDLYGQCSDYDRLSPLCQRYGVPLVEDAAEALGATYRGRHAGSFGEVGVFSFNGNKMITTSGGGMAVTNNPSIATRIRHLATQAREPVEHYEHRELGYNYRMSNLLAAVGRGQLRCLTDRVERRRGIFNRYESSLGDIPGVRFMEAHDPLHAARWLTTLHFDSKMPDSPRDQVIETLKNKGIESRPVWKPMHLQPLYSKAHYVGGTVAQELFETGLCLPSGSSMTEHEQNEVVQLVQKVLGAA